MPTEVACADCTVRVEVERWTEVHRCVQWHDQGPASCPRLARGDTGRGDVMERLKTDHDCSALRASIDDAVLRGEIPVTDRNDEAVRAETSVLGS